VPALRAFQDQLREAGRSRAMVTKTITYLGGLIGDAQDRGLATHNPVHERRKVKKRQEKAAERHTERLEVGVHIPTPAEIRAILHAASGFRRAFIVTAAMTGMRSSELRGLTWHDVDFAAARSHRAPEVMINDPAKRRKSPPKKKRLPC
jgi:integrase